MSEPSIIDRSAHQARAWLNEMAAELGISDHRTAYRVLRGVLHTLRDRLTAEESAQLAAQLPTMIRGIYYEGFQPGRVPEAYHDVDAFLERVSDAALLEGKTQASVATEAVAKVLARNVSTGELDDVLAQLPESLRPLFTAPGGTS
ncbi:MAG TPA: DUF2267 domain-containing protein [Solirubrobacterales bacterium]|jgi:uncharacterized protein (DUF2267 family)